MRLQPLKTQDDKVNLKDSQCEEFRALYYPTDMIAALAETTGAISFERIRDVMLLDKHGRRILRSRPVVSSKTVNLNNLRTLPANTFGYQYSQFLDRHDITPDSRVPVKYLPDEEIAYVALRYRQIHDFMHVLLKLDISVKSELSLKWFEMIQLGLPMNYLSCFFGPLRLSSDDRAVLGKDIAWILNAAVNSRCMMNVMYEDYFQADIDEFRNDLKLIKYMPNPYPEGH